MGLANRLFIWARGQLCARRLDCPHFVHGWGHVHLGPWIRREESKRFYASSFRYTGNRRRWWTDQVLANMGRRRIVVNPASDMRIETGGATYVFCGPPDKNDYFAGLRGHEDYLRESLIDLLRPKVRSEFQQAPRLDVAMHVRRGDFSAAGFEISDDDYFLQAYRQIREHLGDETKFTIFSDAPRAELSNLLRNPGVDLHVSGGDVLDLLSLSKAEIIVTSLKSTFGYWAAFLSGGDVILHPNHQFGALTSGGRFEGSTEMFVSSKSQTLRIEQETK